MHFTRVDWETNLCQAYVGRDTTPDTLIERAQYDPGCRAMLLDHVATGAGLLVRERLEAALRLEPVPFPGAIMYALRTGASQMINKARGH